MVNSPEDVRAKHLINAATLPACYHCRCLDRRAKSRCRRRALSLSARLRASSPCSVPRLPRRVARRGGSGLWMRVNTPFPLFRLGTPLRGTSAQLRFNLAVAFSFGSICAKIFYPRVDFSQSKPFAHRADVKRSRGPKQKKTRIPWHARNQIRNRSSTRIRDSARVLEILSRPPDSCP
jgi:hypothetical protein